MGLYKSDHNKMVKKYIHNGPIWLDENNNSNGLNVYIRKISSAQFKREEEAAAREPEFTYNVFESVIHDSFQYMGIHTLASLTTYYIHERKY